MLRHLGAGGQPDPCHLYVLVALGELEVFFVWIGSLEVSVALESIPSVGHGVGAFVIILSIDIWLSVERGPEIIDVSGASAVEGYHINADHAGSVGDSEVSVSWNFDVKSQSGGGVVKLHVELPTGRKVFINEVKAGLGEGCERYDLEQFHYKFESL